VIELGHVTDRKAPYYAASTRVAFSDTDAQDVVYCPARFDDLLEIFVRVERIVSAFEAGAA
jgi:hypothetical protein